MDSKRIVKIEKYRHRVDSDMDPVSIQAAITDYCFNRCSMCNHHKRNRTYLPFKDWIDFLKERKNLESVCYAGGDMMTYPYHLNDLMNFHLDHDIAFSFITCGFIPHHVSMFLLRKARWIRCSLDTIDEELYQKQRGGISVNSVIKSIKEAIEYGINIELTITVTDITANRISDLLDFAVENRLDADIHPAYGTTFKKLKVENQIKTWVEIFSDNGLTLAPYKHGNYKFTACKAPYYQIYIDSLGDIYPCCTIGGDTESKPRAESLGNISDWEDHLSKRKKFTKNMGNKPDDCKFCIDRFGQINSLMDIKLPHDKNFF